MNLMLLTVALGIPCILLVHWLTKQWFTPASWYWIAWLIALSCLSLAVLGGLLPGIGPLAQELISQSHFGAFVGLLLASVVAVLVRLPAKRVAQAAHIQLPPRWVQRWTVFYLLLGLAHLLYRIVMVGRLSSSLYLDIRMSYLDDPYGLTRIATLGFTPVLPLIALYAFEDFQDGVIRRRRLISLYAAAVVHGVAMGGRIWLIYPPVVYLMSYLLLMGRRSDIRHHVARLLRMFAPILIVALVLFILFGAVRTTDVGRQVAPLDSGPWYQESSGLMLPIMYVAVAPASLELTAQYAAQAAPLNGQLLFSWFAQQLGRLGMIEYVDQTQVMRRDRIMEIDYRVAATQCTVLCLVVGDFGIPSVIFVMAVLMGVCQLVALLWAGQGILRHAIASSAVVAAAMTIQDGWFGIPTNVVGLSAIALLSWLITLYELRRRAAASVLMRGR